MRPLRLPVFILLLLSALSLAAGSISQARLDAALRDLDRSLSHSEDFQRRRQQYIDSLIALSRTNESNEIKLAVADAYISFNTDSALSCLTRDMQAVEGPERLPFQWRHAALLPLGGFIEDATEEYESIPRDAVKPEHLASYLEAGRQMYSYISAFYSSSPALYNRYTDSVRAYQLRLLDILPPESDDYRYMQAEYYFLTERPAMARVLLEDILARSSSDSKLTARTAHHLSSVAKSDGDRTAYLYYLSISARSDIETATREMVSLQELGSQLSDEDIERAYSYTNLALQNAVECGALLRTIDTSQALPVIEKAHDDSVRRWRHRVYGIITGMAVLVLILIALLLVLRYEMVKMKRLQMNLRQANRAKEIYISQFLQLCSVYMHKLTQFSKLVTRKLAAGQSDELYRMAKSGKFVDEQSREFYEIFDDAFLHIYPNFVRDVNQLLRPDSQIELREGEKMNTDLRILAFMRLGIEESARIAQVLNYSLNTIYAYRNRLKARAIDRENFEQNVAKIESLD